MGRGGYSRSVRCTNDCERGCTQRSNHEQHLLSDPKIPAVLSRNVLLGGFTQPSISNGNGRRRCRYSMPFRWLTKPVWKMKTHFNELFNVYKDERIDLKTVRLSRKLGARRRRPPTAGFLFFSRRLSSQAARSSRTSGRAASTSRTATSSRSRPATARSARTSTRWSASPSRWATASTGSAAAARGRKPRGGRRGPGGVGL